MRIFQIDRSRVVELPTLVPSADALHRAQPEAASDRPQAYWWISLTRAEFRESQAEVQAALQALCGRQLVDLHVSDLLNEQLPSHHDYTSDYDVLVFRRLVGDGVKSNMAPAPSPTGGGAPGVTNPPASRAGLTALHNIETLPVGFAVFDRVLLSVHPDDGSIRNQFASRLSDANDVAAAPALDERALTARLPTGPADLMLRVINQIVDGYLELRRELSRQLDRWQAELLDTHSRFTRWGALMQTRQTLRHLNEVCEDQRDAIQDWLDELETLEPDEVVAVRDHELLQVRSRDVLEHIERVTHHVRRLEQDAETAVQMHFNIQSHRTNDIMRVLTVLTAVFLPLNLIAGIFGMNFEYVPLLHKADGFWIAMGSMTIIAAVLIAVFWRKRYLSRTAG
ncbi:magnesium transporter CorA family protein [Variovorax dokdonensis]|uniref:Magnesium transporter CorA family protein n=1 Tax=Variovorax dokdonensis TaxID=344883 RepID=A0ABT7NG89_9BURK|nr:magnesium transporter CorA family protein [Variovorax dokdonensis]MDM0046850.1 magnesium transporter CorA family protein [Variovorax dokdonensis]